MYLGMILIAIIWLLSCDVRSETCTTTCVNYGSTKTPYMVCTTSCY